MRKFGIDAPDMFCFQLDGDDTVYKVPVAASMPIADLLILSRQGNDEARFIAQVEMLHKYMGDVVYDLTATTVSTILRAWGEESNRSGASVGES